jgi:hypothetical protein
MEDSVGGEAIGRDPSRTGATRQMNINPPNTNAKKPPILCDINPETSAPGLHVDHLSALVYQAITLASVRGENMLRKPQAIDMRLPKTKPIQIKNPLIMASPHT